MPRKWCEMRQAKLGKGKPVVRKPAPMVPVISEATERRLLREANDGRTRNNT